MSGNASASVLSQYFAIEVVDSRCVEPAGDADLYFARHALRLRRWLEPRLAALAPRVEALVAAGMSFTPVLGLGSWPDAFSRTTSPARDDEAEPVEVTMLFHLAAHATAAQRGSVAAALEHALADPVEPGLATSATEHLVFRRSAPGLVRVCCRQSAVDDPSRRALAVAFDAATRRIDDAIAGAVARGALHLHDAGLGVRSGVDGNHFVELESAWLVALVGINTPDYDATRRQLELLLSDALAPR